MNPVAIFAPPYRSNSAGVRALYLLRDALSARGVKVRMAGEQKVSAEAVAIFPETVKGNPTPLRKVIRWWLNRPGLLAPYEETGGEHVVSYSAVISTEVPRLFVPTYDLSVMYPKSRPGRGVAYYKGRGDWTPPAGAFAITEHWPPTPELLGDLLRSVDHLVSFDPLSAINFEATLCGTPVIVVPSKEWAREDIERGELGTLGYNWPGDSLDKARAEVRDVWERTAAADFGADVDALVEVLERW